MIRRTMLLTVIALGAILLVHERPLQAGKTQPPAPVYTHTLRWLGYSDQVFESWGYGMNSQRDVVGYAYFHTDEPDKWIGEAFVCWNAPTGSDIINLNEIIRTPDMRVYEAYDINDSRQIIGVLNWRGIYAYPFRYSYETNVLEILGSIGAPPIYGINSQTRINENGDMLVYSYAHAMSCIYPYPADANLLPIPIPLINGIKWAPQDMNNSRQLAGSYRENGLDGGTSFALLFTPPNTFTTFGWLKSPGKYPFGMAMSVNDVGQVTGNMTTMGGIHHAFRYSTSGNKLEDLGGLSGNETFGNSINDSGNVVGNALISPSSTAFVYLEGRGMFDLKKSTIGLTAAQQGTLMTARRIHDNGWILGKIGSTACLLEPVK